MRKTAFCLVLFITVATACKKDNDDPGPANAGRKGLLAGKWKLTKMTFSPAYDFREEGIAETDSYGKLPCEKDDFFTFLSDGTWKADIGLLCDYQDLDDDVVGKWAISDDGNTFTDDERVAGSDGEYENAILQLDEHTFKYQNSKGAVTITMTLTR